MKKPTLIYFAARGRAELIRVVAADAGIDWDEHPVGRGTPPKDGRPTDIPALQATGELPFDAFPVWEEEGFRLAQSGAIVNYIARTHGLHGSTPRDQAKVEEVLGGVEDARQEARKLAMVEADKRAALREELATKTLPKWLGFFDRLLGDRPFFVGNAATVADLAFWHLVELVRDNKLDAGLEKYPRLRAHFDRISARPNLAAYVKGTKRHAFMPLPT